MMTAKDVQCDAQHWLMMEHFNDAVRYAIEAGSGSFQEVKYEKIERAAKRGLEVLAFIKRRIE